MHQATMEVLLSLLLPLLVLPVAILIVRRETPPIKAHLASLKSALARARKPFIVVTDFATAHQLLVQGSRAGAFSNRPPSMTPSALISGRRYHTITSAPYGQHWRALRHNLTSGVLHPTHLHGYAPVRRQALRCLVADLREQQLTSGVVLASECIRSTMFRLVTTMCFGDAIGAHVLRAMDDVLTEIIQNLSAVRRFAFLPFLPLFTLIYRKQWNSLMAIRKKQERLYLPLIDRCRSHPRGSDETPTYVHTLLDLHVPVEEAYDDNSSSGGKQRRLEDGELVGLCSEFLGSNIDSVSAALQWIMANLIKRPDIQEAIREEINAAVDADAGEVGEEVLGKMEHLNAVILEALRLHPTTLSVFRQMKEEDQVFHDGQRIPSGTRMVFPLRDLARDKTVWDDPDEFKPERFHGYPREGSATKKLLSMAGEMKMMPFGAGRRMCPAISVSVLHIGYFMANLVREFKWVEAEGEDAVKLHANDIVEMFNFMKHPLHARLVILRPEGKKIR